MKKIVIAGGSGFLGGILAAHFLRSGCEIIVLTRSPKAVTGGIREMRWDAQTPGDWARELENASAIINLTGRSVNCRYSERNRKLILDSRIQSTRVIGEAIAKCKSPPAVWLNASTATIYKHTFGPAWDESGQIGGTREAKDEFSIDVAKEWERTFCNVQAPATRKVALRTAMVLGMAKNSVFPMLLYLTRFGLGGKMGNGRQFVSWIHAKDFCRAVEWLITRDTISGAVNIAAPNPVTNEIMMQTLRDVCRIPAGFSGSRWMLEVGAFILRTETELIIKSRRVIPQRLLESGFTFCFPTLRVAFADLSK